MLTFEVADTMDPNAEFDTAPREQKLTLDCDLLENFRGNLNAVLGGVYGCMKEHNTREIRITASIELELADQYSKDDNEPDGWRHQVVPVVKHKVTYKVGSSNRIEGKDGGAQFAIVEDERGNMVIRSVE